MDGDKDPLAPHGDYAKRLALERLRRAGFGEGEAEEVVQEVRVAFLKGGLPAGRAYLGAAVLNAARAWLRGEGRRHARERGVPLRPAPEAPDEPLLRKEDAERLGLAMAALEPGDQMVLRWIYWEGLSYAQAAALLGVKANSIGPLLSRARERLKAALEKS